MIEKVVTESSNFQLQRDRFYKEPADFLAIMTNIETVQLFELILILGKIGGQIYMANFFRSLIFI